MELRPARGPRLVLQLSPRDEGLTVEIVESPLGEGAAAAIMLQRIDDVLRMVSQPTFHEDVGRGLFRALFSGDLAAHYRAAFTQASVEGERLAVELRFHRDLIRTARYPWELLHDGTRFLLQSGAVSLVRSLDCPAAPPPPEVTPPLEILLVAAHPTGHPRLASEYAQLQAAFDDAIRDLALDLAYLLPPTWDALMDWLLAGAPDVLHFEGHGDFTRTGLLLFEDTDGASDPVDAATVGGAFGSTDLRLAVLSACTPSGRGETLLSSVAPALVAAGIPAVVAMQQAVPEDVAALFSRAFYEALLAGHAVESAVAVGRRQLARTMYWHVPALFLRTDPAAELAQATLPCRVDTAAPRRAPTGYPLRVGVWVRSPDAPHPAADAVRRLLGLEPDPAPGDPAYTGTDAPDQPPEPPGQIRAGAVEVRLAAPGCEIHNGAQRTLTVVADGESLPVWFALTPRRPGPVDLTFELRQGETRVVAAVHPLLVTRDADEKPVAVVRSHFGSPPPPASPAPPAEPEAVAASDAASPVTDDEYDRLLDELELMAVLEQESEADASELAVRAPVEPDAHEPAAPRVPGMLLAALLIALIVIAALAAVVLLGVV